jgi:hypothetical protein
MLATRRAEKPPAVDEIFDTDNTDRRIARRIDGGNAAVWDVACTIRRIVAPILA